ncbi:hypothetical protein [Leptothoe kymatousa]|uniref:Uncharacterized protein n=1 Tax=Leptothoe kymatousa TAU-MAC 1615 TaxID=2364775 RepID=A0ABS5Y6G7_9CYAN|nr:hypothetical protein [Leptothoe kymatousa]MBT9313417.1 hypothetical protein [Leptothoe kymatousa TAU-MAC 1615]
MVGATDFVADITQGGTEQDVTLDFKIPDPSDINISDQDFNQQIDIAWQVCDRFDLQTDIWRGRILRAVRDREKQGGDGRGTGFLNWLKDREISKSQAYALIELGNSADELLQEGLLNEQSVNQFSKRAFVETAQAAPEVQQMVTEAARRGEQITRKEVKQLSDEWTAMTSDLIPETVREKAANNSIPTRYLTPLVKEMEKLPPSHQATLRTEAERNPDVDTLKQITSEARYLSKYIAAASQVQTIDPDIVNLEQALEEALRIGCLNSTADLVNQATQLEQAVAKLYTAWRRINKLAERVYVDSGESTPQLRALLSALAPLTNELIEIQLGSANSPSSKTVRLKVIEELE